MSFHKPYSAGHFELELPPWASTSSWGPFSAQIISSSSDTIRSVISSTLLTKYMKTLHSLYPFLPPHCILIRPSLPSFPKQGGYWLCKQLSGSKFTAMNGNLTILLAEGKLTISDKVASHTRKAIEAGWAGCWGTQSRESRVCGKTRGEEAFGGSWRMLWLFHRQRWGVVLGGELILGKEKSLVKGVETKQCPREEQAAQLAPVTDGPTWNLVRGWRGYIPG